MRLNSPLSTPLSERQRVVPDRSGYVNTGGGIGESAIAIEPIAGSYEKRTAVSASVATAWNVRVNVGNSQQSLWDIRRIVSDSVQTRWHVLRLVTDSIASTWDIRSFAHNEFTSEWSIGNMLVVQVPSEWHIAGVTGKSQDVQWHIRTWTQTSQDTAWHIYTTVAKSRSSRWNLRAFINKNRDVRWNTNSFAHAERDSTWNIRQWVTDHEDVRWHSFNDVYKSVDIAWDTNVLYPVSNSLDTEWHITGWMPEHKTQASEWSILQSVHASFDARWNQSGFINKQQRAEWMNLSYRLIPYNNIEYTKRVLADGPLAYWKLNSNDTLVEETGNYPLEFVGNAPQAAVRGLVAGDDTSIHLVDYAGATAGFRFVHPISIYVGSWSIEGWINLVGGDGGVIVHDTGFELGWEAGKVFATIDTTTYQSTSTYDVGEVLHAVWTYDATEQTLNVYVNGVLEISELVVFTPPSSTNLHIGAHANMFDGNVDEFAFYTSALPQVIAQAHYALGADAYDYNDIILQSRPAAYWNFHEYFSNTLSTVVGLDNETHVNTVVTSGVMQLSPGAFEGTRTGTWSAALNQDIKGVMATWTGTVPDGTTMTLEFSIDGGENYFAVENEIPFILLDSYYTDAGVLSRFTLTSEDGVATPSVSAVTFYLVLATEDDTNPLLLPAQIGPTVTAPTGVNYVGRPGAFFSNDGSALEFSGVSGSSINMNYFPTADSFTYEFWFKPDALGLNSGLLSHTGGSARISWGNSASIASDNLHIRITKEGETSTANTTNTPGLTLGEWHHIVVTFDILTSSTQITYWIDGVKRTKTVAWRMTRPANTYINRRDTSTTFDGQISHPAIYERKLTDEEVLRHWEAGEYGRYVPVRAQVPATTISSGPTTMYARSWEFVGS